MAWNRVEFSGLDELKRALLELPDELLSESNNIVTSHATRAAARIRAAYPEKSGNLRDGVEVEHLITGYTVRSTVRSKAPHAWWYDHGTETRKYGEQERGRMEAKPTFIPITQEERRAMYVALVALVKRAGLEVSAVDTWSESAA